jgi:hypothetical protein
LITAHAIQLKKFLEYAFEYRKRLPSLLFPRATKRKRKQTQQKYLRNRFTNADRVCIIKASHGSDRLRLGWSKDPGPPRAGDSPAVFVATGERVMPRKLSVFIDESGDFGRRADVKYTFNETGAKNPLPFRLLF